MTYEEKAKLQNMSVARSKAVDILELLRPELEGEEWYAMEDEVTNIIEEK